MATAAAASVAAAAKAACCTLPVGRLRLHQRPQRERHAGKITSVLCQFPLNLTAPCPASIPPTHHHPRPWITQWDSQKKGTPCERNTASTEINVQEMYVF